MCVAASTAGTAEADVFNGRITFSSFRTDPSALTGDSFTMNHDGSDLRQLTTNPADDAQSDWSPDGRDIAYRIRKPNSRINFEVSRMSASGPDGQTLTDTRRDRRRASRRRSPIAARSCSGAAGPAWSLVSGGWVSTARTPSCCTTRRARSSIPACRSTRAVHDDGLPHPRHRPCDPVLLADGTGLTTLFDVAGALDTGPAWSPDATRIAFKSDADVAGGNPERDREIWVMDAGGGNPKQITQNAIHDEGAAWSPDGTMLTYSSGIDEDHTDINVMTANGVHLRRLTDFDGLDQSPDWQSIPAPETDRRCGDLDEPGTGARDVRTAGLACSAARRMADRWARTGRPPAIRKYAAEVVDYGGTLRVMLSRRGRHRDRRIVAFLYQPPAPR